MRDIFYGNLIFDAVAKSGKNGMNRRHKTETGKGLLSLFKFKFWDDIAIKKTLLVYIRQKIDVTVCKNGVLNGLNQGMNSKHCLHNQISLDNN